MLKEGMKVFYIEENRIFAGKVIDIETKGNEVLFSIDSYGTCEGQYRIQENQIGKWVFLKQEDAEAYLAILMEK